MADKVNKLEPGSSDGIVIGGVADLTVQHDVQTELRLPAAAFQIMEHILAAPDGEIAFTYDGIKPESRAVIKRMVTEGVVREIEYIREEERTNPFARPFRWGLRLTDLGMNALEENRKRRIIVGQMRPVVVTPAELEAIRRGARKVVT